MLQYDGEKIATTGENLTNTNSNSKSLSNKYEDRGNFHDLMPSFMKGLLMSNGICKV